MSVAFAADCDVVISLFLTGFVDHSSWWTWERSSEKWPNCKKQITLHHFWCFFSGLGLLWRVLETVLGRFWELFWKMLAPRWCFLGYLKRFLDILAPRLANKGARCSRWPKKLDFWKPGGGRGWRNSRMKSRVPPLEKLQRKGLELPPPPGAPNSTWKLVELRLWMELPMDQVTQHVPEGTWRIYTHV